MLSARSIPNPALYRIHPVSFRDGQGNGVGDYRGLNGVCDSLLPCWISMLRRLFNVQPYTQAATPSGATLPLAWRHGAQRESHQGTGGNQWVMPGFASTVFLHSDSYEKLFAQAKE